MNYTKYTIQRGPTTEVFYETLPPSNTLAIVVDVSSAGSAMNIRESLDNDLGVAAIGIVGKEDATNLIIVPWGAG